MKTRFEYEARIVVLEGETIKAYKHITVRSFPLSLHQVEIEARSAVLRTKKNINNIEVWSVRRTSVSKITGEGLLR